MSAIAIIKGLIDCSEAYRGRIRGDLAKECIKIAVENYGLKIRPKETPYKPIILEEKREINYKELRLDVNTALATRKRQLATELIVQAIEDSKYVFTTKEDTRNEMWIYDDGIYVPQGKSEVKRIVREITGEAFTTHLCNEVTAKIEADTFINKDDFFGHNYIDEVPIQNGILNLITRDVKPFTPSQIFFNKLPVSYDPNATCPAIDKHFKDVLKSEDDAKVFYEIVGFCLWKDYFIEKAIMLVGDGRNGKGKTIDLIKRFIGVDNTVSVPLAEINTTSFRVSELFGKMINLAGDLSDIALKDTGLFKQTTGRDVVGAKRKFLTAINFINYAKFVFACNKLPRVYDTSKGFWERWVLFEFPYTFKEPEIFDGLKESEIKMNNYKKMDSEHINKISTPEELNGLLIKALNGLDRIRKNKGFSYSKGSEDIKQFWVRKSDSFTAFCLDHLEEDAIKEIAKAELRKAFNKYCKRHSLKGCSDKNIKAVLEEMFGATEFRGSKDDRDRYWSGLKFKGSSEFNLKLEKGEL
jgi:putative DNA primase/helicase